MRPRSWLPLALLLLPTLAGCGGPADPVELTRAGYGHLNSGNTSAAESSFRRALEGLEPSHPEYVRATLGLAQVVAPSDPDRAKDLFLELALALPIQEGDYRLVAGALVQGRHFDQATEIVQAGMSAYPESPRMAELRDYVGDAALHSGAEVPEALRGLGYVGSD